MRFKLIFLLCLIPLLSWASVSLNKVKQVYTQLLKYNSEIKGPSLLKLDLPEINAFNYKSGQLIVITKKMMNWIRNKDELALILGHELGHNKWHTEARADEYGAKYSIKAGFNYCRGALIFKRSLMKYGDYPIHPTGASRWASMRCGK